MKTIKLFFFISLFMVLAACGPENESGSDERPKIVKLHMNKNRVDITIRDHQFDAAGVHVTIYQGDSETPHETEYIEVPPPVMLDQRYILPLSAMDPGRWRIVIVVDDRAGHESRAATVYISI